MKSIQNYIDGRFVPGKREFADVNPADGKVIAQVGEADKAQVDEAVHAARRALREEWGRLGVRERAARLHRVADTIEKRFDCFVQAEVADTGKPISLATTLDVPRAAANFRVFADLVKMAGLESFQTEAPEGTTALNYAVRKPLGVIWRNHTLESALAFAYVESRACVGVRERGRGQAVGRNSRDSYASRRVDARSRNSKRGLQRGAWFRSWIGGRVPDAAPWRGCHHFYRRVENRCGHHEVGGADGETSFV